MPEPLTPCCPMCGEPPMMVMGGGTQAFCGNSESCQVFTWNPMDSREEFLRTARQLEIQPSGEVDPGPDGSRPPLLWHDES